MTYRIHVSRGTTPSTGFYARDACIEDSRLLARPTYRPRVRQISSSRSASSRGRQSDRVTFITLTMTSSFLERLSAIEEPFSELEHLVLLTRDNVQLTLPSTFRWGPRLRCLHLTTRIAFPTLLQLLNSSRNLVDLQLHGVLNPRRFSLDTFVNTLSGMAWCQSLSLYFLPTEHYLDPYPPPGERVVLPVLTRLHFRGLTSTWAALWPESKLV